MLARELGISKASALLPVTMPTHRAQNLHRRKGRPQSHSPSKDSDRELERGSNRAAPGARVDGQHPGIESGYVMEGDVLLKVLRPLQSPALGLAFDGLCGEHRGFFQHSQVRILAPQPPSPVSNLLSCDTQELARLRLSPENLAPHREPIALGYIPGRESHPQPGNFALMSSCPPSIAGPCRA